MHRKIGGIIFSVYCVFLTIMVLPIRISTDSDFADDPVSCSQIEEKNEPSEAKHVQTEAAKQITWEAETSVESTEYILSKEEIDLIALVTMAEAEGECEQGKRLVIDTVLNRVDSEYFPNSVQEVIYQPGQFSSMWNGRVDRCEVRDDICELVLEELKNRINYEVVFFTAGHYGNYGVPMFQVGNHYFSSYD